MNAREIPPLVGESAAIRRVRDLIDRYAATAMSILIVGATGTGKEVVARHLHARSRRRGQFVPVNCGALPAEMVEGLLFGHRRGAFSGAVDAHRGFVECSDGGTLFLDEALSLPPAGQAKLLRVIESQEIQPLGSERLRPVDLRVVTAVQEDVVARRDRGAFRRDLYQRLADVVIELPPLVERMGDIVPIALYYAARQGRTLEPGAVTVLRGYSWPGNVRELCQVLERAAHLVVNGTLPPAAMAEAIALGAPSEPQRWPQAAMLTPARIAAACAEHEWSVSRAAAALGVHRATLFRRLRALGLTLRQLRESQSH